MFQSVPSGALTTVITWHARLVSGSVSPSVHTTYGWSALQPADAATAMIPANSLSKDFVLMMVIVTILALSDKYRQNGKKQLPILRILWPNLRNLRHLTNKTSGRFL
jgi:hypothetical protein